MPTQFPVRSVRRDQHKTDRVAIGYVHPVEVHAAFHHSLIRLLRNDNTIVDVIPVQSGGNISNARNMMVDRFLAGTADWLWIVDTDMTFGHDVVRKLLQQADRTTRPIVGALCYGVRALESDELFVTRVEVFPTAYFVECHDDTVRVHNVVNLPDVGLTQVHATGAASLLVHRDVFTKFPDHAMRWFRESVIGDQPVGEDVTFCLQAGSLGFPVFVDTRIKMGHCKTFVVTERFTHDNPPRVLHAN